MRKRTYVVALVALSFISSIISLAQARGETIALTNARIVTVSGAPIEKGTIVIRDGIIEAVGASAKVPGDARVIDASGLTVYPGIFDALSNLGVAAAAAPQQRGPGQGGGPQAAQQTAPTTNSNYPNGMQPEKDVVDELRGGDAQFESVRNAGFTTALTVGRDGVFNGRSAVINLAGDTVSGMVVKDGFAQHFTFRTLGTVYPSSLMGTFSSFRQMLLDAKRLQELQRSYAANPRGMRRPENDRSLEALFPVVNGTMPIVFNANSEIEIIRALGLAKELGLKAIIGGGIEAWRAADRLKAQNVPVLLSLNFPKRTTAASPDADPENLETLRLRADAPKGPGALLQKGVRFAFQSGGASPADFFANALKATENGLPRDAAVRAMTLSAAEILGVDDRLGSVEAGKIANLTVTRGDILSKDRVVTHVFVDGRLFEQKERPRPPVGQTAVSNNPPTFTFVGGTWKITIAIPDQAIGGTLTLSQQGPNFTGTMQTDATGTSPVRDGKISADGMSFSSTVAFGGASFDITVSGKINGDQISGTINSPQGAIPFSGTKVP